MVWTLETAATQDILGPHAALCHLLPVVDLFDPDSPEGTRKMRLPDSNCIIVAEKPLQD